MSSCECHGGECKCIVECGAPGCRGVRHHPDGTVADDDLDLAAAKTAATEQVHNQADWFVANLDTVIADAIDAAAPYIAAAERERIAAMLDDEVVRLERSTFDSVSVPIAAAAVRDAARMVLRGDH